MAHGWFQRDDGETILYLANADNQVAPVTASRLLERLDQLEGARGLPHFVFLATCESASAEAEGALGGLAQRLVRELGMPAVLAMTEKISITTAEALAKEFYLRLREHGEPDRALVEACAGLADRYDITVPALYSRLGGRPLFSDTADRPLTNKEIGFGLSRLDDLLPKRAPILQKTFDEHAAILRKSLDTDPEALSEAARQERREALVQINTICDEALDLSFNALALGQEPPEYDERSPFRGLYPFRMEDRKFFFGREMLVHILHQKLVQDHFLAILGPSGSGKSSVVLAGLIPALQEEESGLRMIYLTPGSDPLSQLEASLSEVSEGSAVLVVDQFEEVFTLCSDEANRQAFLGQLLTLPEQLPVVITMRADFWGECAPYRELKERMQARQELIAPMDTTELRRAMEQQARTVGLRFEADLSHTILEDVQGEPGAMPLLQHALQELWKRRHGQWLRAQEYRNVGGVKKAIAETAESVYRELSREEQERVRDIFVRVTRLDEEVVQGEERRDTRRRVWLEELVPAGSDLAATKDLVRRLADTRLIVTSVNATTKREEVEVAHEALIRYWPRLRGWLDEDRASLRLRARIGGAAREWEHGKREESLLIHRGGRLEEAETLTRNPKFPLSELERAYVNACVALRERERAEKEEQQRRELEAARKLAEEQQKLAQEAEARQAAEKEARREAEQRAEEQTKSANRLRRRAFALAVVVVLAIGAAVFALIQQQKAQENERLAEVQAEEAEIEREKAETRRIEAEKQQKISRSRELAALAMTVVETDPTLSFRLAEAALRIEPTRLAQKALFLPLQYQFHNILQGHTGTVANAAFSPDGARVVTESGDTARVWHVATGEELHRLIGHTEGIWSVSFSPDGNWIVTASSDTTTRIWDATTGKEIHQLNGHTDKVRSAVFSPDGNWIVTASSDTTTRIWDATTGKDIHQLNGHTDKVRSAVFSPDGTRIVSASEDKTARVWDATTGKEIRQLTGHTAEIHSVAFSPDGTRIVTASEDRTARVWDATTGKELYQLTGHIAPVWEAMFSPDGTRLLTASHSDENTVRLWDATTGWELHRLVGDDAAFSPDGKKIITGSALDYRGRIWDATTGKELYQLIGHTDFIFGTAFSPDGTQVITWSQDRTARLWVVGAGEGFHRLTGHTGHLWNVVFSPDGTQIVTTSRDKTVRVWDATTGKGLQRLIGHTKGVWSAAFSLDGTRILTASEDGTARIWDAATGKELYRLTGVVDMVEPYHKVAFSPDGKQLVTVLRNEVIRLWDVFTGEELHQLTGHTGFVSSVAFSPDGSWIVTTSEDKTARVWDVATGEELHQLTGHTGTVWRAMFSPDGTRIVTTSPDGTARVWDVATGEELHQLTGYAPLTFSPDGARVVTISDDYTARVWDVATGEEFHQLTGHTNRVWSVAFSPDGNQIVTTSEDQTVRIWDATTGEELHQLTGHTSYVSSAAFSPDGAWIVTASYDGTARIWPTSWEEALRLINEEKVRGVVRGLTEEEKRQYGFTE